jgi:serine/threonine-protein kinase
LCFEGAHLGQNHQPTPSKVNGRWLGRLLSGRGVGGQIAIRALSGEAWRGVMFPIHWAGWRGVSLRLRRIALEAEATKQIITDLTQLVGESIEDRYDLVRVLGRGGMGVVFEGVQRSMGRRCAVKLLQLSGVLEGEALRRFEREIGIIAGLQHPNIVHVLDSGQDKRFGLFFIVMELIEGEPLSRLLADPPATAHPAMALEITYQVCAALTEPHAQGIIHRDIKPDNVLLTVRSDESVQVKLVDFGVARAWSTGEEKLTGTGIALGTPAYMAPELCEAGELDGRTDLYAVGVMLYELLAGRPPFEGGGALGLMIKHLHEEPPPLPATHPALVRWPEVEQLTRKLLAKKPADRPQSARDVLRRIDAIRALHGIAQVRVDGELPAGEAMRAFFPPLPSDSVRVAAWSAAGSAPQAPTTPGATARVTPGQQAALLASPQATAPVSPDDPQTVVAPAARSITAQVAPPSGPVNHSPRHDSTQILPPIAPMPADDEDAPDAPRNKRGQAAIAALLLFSVFGCGAASLGGLWYTGKAPALMSAAGSGPTLSAGPGAKAARPTPPVKGAQAPLGGAQPVDAKEAERQREADKTAEEQRREAEAQAAEAEREQAKKSEVKLPPTKENTTKPKHRLKPKPRPKPKPKLKGKSRSWRDRD